MKPRSYFQEYILPGIIIFLILLFTYICYRLTYDRNTLYGENIYALVFVPGVLFLVFNFKENDLYSYLDLEIIGGILVLSGLSPYIQVYNPVNVVPLIRVLLEL